MLSVAFELSCAARIQFLGPLALFAFLPRQLKQLKVPTRRSVTLGISLVVARMPPAYNLDLMPLARLFDRLRRLMERRTFDGDVLKSDRQR
jgi:hypothetical protein